jgi:thymidylate synthase (FAD)
MKIDVLDHGFVRLVDNMGGDLSVVRSARVSHDADWRSGDDADKDEKLIKYLAKHQHYSPFESVVMTFEVCCPIFIARQWMRHRTWSYNEMSARYTGVERKFYLPEPELIGMPSPTNKQGRVVNDESKEAHKALNAYAHKKIFTICETAFDAYDRLIESGCPRELARSVLPLATYTRFFGTVNLLNLAKFIKLRDEEGAQWEIQEYARALTALAKTVAPTSVKALLE